MSELSNSPWPVRRRRRDEKREAVINTAARLFQEKGYDNTSLNEIAEALNVTKPTLYHYVENKAEILGECHSRTWDAITAATRLAADAGRSGLENIDVFVRAYVGTISTDYGKVMIADIRARGETGASRHRKAMRRTDALLRGFIEQGIRDGSVAACDPRLTAFAIFGALNWITFWHDSAGPNDQAAIADAFMRLFRDGLKPATRPGGGFIRPRKTS
jgi:AcrR family transcriptional regulator